MRIVSLLASGTEIVCGLGAGEFLVGRSHECDNPDWVRKLPVCTSPAFDVSASSGQIDAEVRRRLKAAEPLYNIDTNLIRNLKPDLLISQAHCEVCAVTPGDVQRADCIIAGQVLALVGGSLAGIDEGIRNVARALEREEAGEALIERMTRRISSVAGAVRNRRPPSVAILEWTDPIFATGNWVPELVEAANGNLVLGEKGKYSSAIAWEEVQKADPEYLIIAPCGFDLERSQKELPGLERLPGWFNLKAVREAHVAVADGNKYFNRSGTTIVETVEIIAEIIHGYNFGAVQHRQAWQMVACPASRTEESCRF